MNLFEQLMEGIGVGNPLHQHPRVGRDAGERRVDFMRNASGEQSD